VISVLHHMKNSIHLRVIFSTILVLLLSGVCRAAENVPRWETLPPVQPLPELAKQGHVDHLSASIWYGVVGEGQPVILLHGGLESSQDWGNQVSALLENHYQVILIDTRGHGRSTLGTFPLSYELMQSDVIAVMDELHLQKAKFVGWSDGAIMSLITAIKYPERVEAVFAFGANMNLKGVNPNANSAPILAQLAPRLEAEYESISPTPDGFATLAGDLNTLQAVAPDYSTVQLEEIQVRRIAIVDGDHDEFVLPEHESFLARTIPGARLIILNAVSHFAPWQDPEGFNRMMLQFLGS
jgi:pimeloyl-ACP methyl ester carboxylesterase